jgi:predicted PurR-regulated permease PerM
MTGRALRDGTDYAADPAATAESSTKRIAEAALVLATCIAFYLCWIIARPFLPAITWALALAVVGYPIHRWLERRLMPSLAAVVSVTVITGILLVPGFSLLQQVISEAGNNVEALAQNLTSTQLHRAAEKYFFTQKLLEWLESNFDINQELKRAAGVLAAQVPAALRGSLQFVTQFAIMLVMLFYFLRDHERLVKYLRSVVPLSATEAGELLQRISETIYATIYGGIVVKLVQGLLGGVMFWILGLPAAALFGAMMAVLATLPILGTSIVWGPAAIVLLAQGSWIKALILVVWGALVVSLIDNLLYPVLIASDLRVHTLAVFVSVFGGLIAFGAAGVVLGPVILATAAALMDVWRIRTRGDRLNPGDPTEPSRVSGQKNVANTDAVPN